MTFRASRLAWNVLGRTAAAAFLAFLVAPVLALVLSLRWDELTAGLSHPLAVPALKLTLLTSACSLLVVTSLGTLLAWQLALGQSRAARWLETLSQIPIVMPPAVAGLGLLLAFGQQGVFGRWLTSATGLTLPFTTAAVVMAESFVSAPFYIQAAVAAFRRLDPELLLAARSLGASPARVFARVGLPLSVPALVGGAATSWARAIGEFGATLMFAGNLTGRTQTMSLAVYTSMESDLRAAQSLAVVLVAVAFGLLAALQMLRPASAPP
ncbi:MAG TPA: molybdate ABC transporter permease subunit [Myxococcaceae bacterium]